MSTNQLHGKTFEREVITTCFGITEELADSFPNTALFDIPFGVITCQHPTGNPVSIKTAAIKAARRAANVCLADARRVWSWDQPVVLVVGLYTQVGKDKVFHTIYEFLLNLDAAQRVKLYGSVSLQEVSDFHNGIKTFGPGAVEGELGKKWARDTKKPLKKRLGIIQLNQKIDSKRQRRLQCSAKLNDLEEACTSHLRFTGAQPGYYRGLKLPYTVFDSSSRELGQSQGQAGTSAL